jgi:hypothetical protein
VTTSEGLRIPVAGDDGGITGGLDKPTEGLETGLDDGVDAGGDPAGAVDPGGIAENEEIVNVPVRGRVFVDAGGPEFGDDTGQTVVEIAMVEVTTIVECAGQLVTVGAQLVMVISVVVKTVDVVKDGVGGVVSGVDVMTAAVVGGVVSGVDVMTAAVVGGVVSGVDVMTAAVVGEVTILLGLDEEVDTVSVLVETEDEGVVTTEVLVEVVKVLEEGDGTTLFEVEVGVLVGSVDTGVEADWQSKATL